MEIEKYENFTPVDFLKDKNFLRWQIFKEEEDALFWNRVMEENPSTRTAIEEALILYHEEIKLNDFNIPRTEITNSLTSLQNQIREKKKDKTRALLLRVSAVAASLALIVSLTMVLTRERNHVDISTFATSFSSSDDLYSSDTKLIVSEQNTVILNNKESTIQYEEETIKADDNLIVKEELSSYNQLITPYGKRSVITFSDGTKAWVNAGSKLTYPVEFGKSKREIYIDGEIYIEVAEDKSRPFIVKTRQMDINVLGTKFNVSAYEADMLNSVVLAAGSVRISPTAGNKKVTLAPNQIYSYSHGNGSVEEVDASIYTLWTKGLYQFESEVLANIIVRLERYYGVKIDCDSTIATLKCSGKLDMKDDLEKLLTDLTRALPITFHHENDNTYIINAKS